MAQMAIVFRGVRLQCASRDCLDLLSQGAASIAFCLASAHCDGSESLSLRHRTYLPFTPTERRGWPEMSPFPKRTFCADVDCSGVAQKLSIAGSFESRPAGAQSSERYPANIGGRFQKPFPGLRHRTARRRPYDVDSLLTRRH